MQRAFHNVTPGDADLNLVENSVDFERNTIQLLINQAALDHQSIVNYYRRHVPNTPSL